MSFSNLTDKELRQELLKHGVNCGPVTASTRGLYVKRLMKIKDKRESFNVQSDISQFTSVQSKSKTQIPNRKSFGFSSDDSDNNETKDSSKVSRQMSLRKRSHRLSKESGTKSLPPSPAKKPQHKVLSTLKGRSIASFPKSSTSASVTNGYSDESDEEQNSWKEIMAADVSTSPMSSSFNNNSFKTTPRRPLRFSKQYICLNESKKPDTPDAKQSSKRSRTNGDLPKPETYFLRNRASRCYDVPAKASADNQKGAGDSKYPNEEKDPHSEGNAEIERTNSSAAFGLTEPVSRPWHLHCSALLPIGTVVFFVVLGLLYVTLRSDETFSAKSALPDFSAKDDTMLYIHQIHSHLSTLAGAKLCNSHITSDRMTVLELKTRLKVENVDFLKALQLIKENPQWDIKMFVDEEGTMLTDQNLSDVTFMSSGQPTLTTKCRFMRAIEKVLIRVGLVLGVGLAIWLVILYRQHVQQKEAEERQKMFVLVEKILDALKSNFESSEKDEAMQPYLPIVHVRDMLIMPQERKKMLSAWEKAVHFISASESRVRVENQRIAGEDFDVWRWIQVTSPAKKQQPPARIWQGEAFDTNRSINTPTFSPTPCLKIRNMFNPEVEKDDNWEFQIQQSILEKCADNNEIVSIVLEKKSAEGLVYLKCETCAGAGRAFRSLHGSWFDGRLVTVKFIKLARYHTRYPHTESCKTPLKPNLQKPVSTFQPSAPCGPLTSTPMKT